MSGHPDPHSPADDPHAPASLKFLGTAGARFVVASQLRASGGLWLELAGQRIMIDPGPGALVRALASRPKLDPAHLDAVVVTHRHLDHANDVNCILEAVTAGGHSPRGLLLGPPDLFEPGSVLCPYVLDYVAAYERTAEGRSYGIGAIVVRTPVRHDHPGDTFGLVIEAEGRRLGLVADTRYFDALAAHYAGCDLLVVHCVLVENPERRIYHLSLEDAAALIAAARPRRAILTHFGMNMLRAKPWVLAERLSQQLGLPVAAARDGQTVAL